MTVYFVKKTRKWVGSESFGWELMSCSICLSVLSPFLNCACPESMICVL